MAEHEINEEILTEFESEMNDKFAKFDERLKKVDNRTWYILVSIIGGFGTFLLSLLMLLVPLLEKSL